MGEWAEWCQEVSAKKRAHFQGSPADWTRRRESHWWEFAKGVVALLNTELGLANCRPGAAVTGFSLAVRSGIPTAGGLSSSSSLVVSLIMAVNTLFDLGLGKDDVVKLGVCEHYNGTKGGTNDHAAIVHGKAGQMLLMGSLPDRVVQRAEMASSVSIFLAESNVKRSQAPSVSAKLQREGVVDPAVILARTQASYAIAALWARTKFPDFSQALQSRFDDFGLMRELNSGGNVVFASASDRAAAVYRVLLSMPELASRALLREALPDCETQLDALFASHPEPEGGYNLRGYALYGWAENERNFEFMARSAAGDLPGMLEVIRVSQDGDRASKNGRPWVYSVSTQQLEQWLASPSDHPLWSKEGWFERSIE
eukprot:CAMPEP_0175125898 /NCGR_PEP_ID=MMETSP0087-20121206/3556_1 /TAXON_ID=136419 /ORGANISM="Unknown Unknown, Strain D1" /LENGTH=368 /DNA_ID=CAMNT_0016407755 /DNA_START=255 /DNA_END=1358 /DNA_ORIENTATION=+